MNPATWQHLLAHVLGFDNPAGHWATWWSGPGGDISELAVLGVVIGLIRRHTCREHGCRHLTWDHYVDSNGQSWPACHRHHPLHPRRLHAAGRFHFALLHAQRETL